MEQKLIKYILIVRHLKYFNYGRREYVKETKWSTYIIIFNYNNILGTFIIVNKEYKFSFLQSLYCDPTRR